MAALVVVVPLPPAAAHPPLPGPAGHRPAVARLRPAPAEASAALHTWCRNG